MRRAFVLLMMAMPIATGRVWAAPDCVERDPAVTVRIHDYVHLPSASLARARQVVSRLYGKIGVRVDWLGVVQQGGGRRRPAAEGETPYVPAQLTINILTPKMAARARVAEGVLGYAAVAHEGGMGRIAYVIYDRVRDIAASGPVNEVDLLGFVMAHEAGHLLLGPGSRSRTGIMQCHWDRRHMQRLDALAIGFSELQAVRIRDTIKYDSPTLVAGHSPAAGGCVAARAEGASEENVTDRDSTKR
jgi:hypothetical protein